jgi:hypothetical protein
MMDLREFVARSMERTREYTLDMVKDLTPEQLRWRPAPGTNCVAFLLFHVFRAEDRYFHRWISGDGELWERREWSQRWVLPSPPSNPDSIWTTGNSWTVAEVEAWQPPPLSELLAYGETVRRSGLAVLHEFDLARLPEAPRAEFPNLTLTHYLISASHHEAQHQGQIDYLLGLMTGVQRG